MTAWAERDDRFRRQYGISRSSYYTRRREGLSHDEAVREAQSVARLRPHRSVVPIRGWGGR